jgi:hypothetical protein
MEFVSKTLIYCGQFCNNAVNYAITPLSEQDSPQDLSCHDLVE